MIRYRSYEIHLQSSLIFKVQPINIFFFFQAEDGIRDLYVTGVQTCALPISALGETTLPKTLAQPAVGRCRPRISRRKVVLPAPRSEERRVGKECRSRWS